LEKTKVSTVEIYKKNFSFPEVARNDFAAEKLEELEIAEKNFNSNIDNKELLKNFILTAQGVKKSLKEKYGD